MENDQCRICGRIYEENHEISNRHIFNELLCKLLNQRDTLSRTSSEIKIEVSTENSLLSGELLTIRRDTNKRQYKSILTQDEMFEQVDGITFNFKITAKEPLDLIHCDKIHTYNEFIFTGQNIENVRRLERGESFSVQLKLISDTIGDYIMPINFAFVSLTTKRYFSVIKEMMISIIDSEDIEEENTKKVSPFTQKKWVTEITVPPVNSRDPNWVKYKIPKNLEEPLKYFIKNYIDEGIASRSLKFNEIRNCLDEELSSNNYTNNFHYLLWLDEIVTVHHILKFNMEKVKVEIEDYEFVKLNVPGLAEKRPSLLRNDVVNIKIYNDRIAYQGIIQHVGETDISIKNIHPEFLEVIRRNPTIEFDVKFEISRLPYERMHQAIDLCRKENKFDKIFPNISQIQIRNDIQTDLSFRNEKLNEEQKTAVRNIFNGTSGDAPYIVFGPPGTGKTITIVEAIYQILKHDNSANILVCAPSNAACDMLALKLANYFDTNEMIRIHSQSVDWNLIPDAVKHYSNREDREFTKNITGRMLQRYKIIITTLQSAGKYAEKFTASHVFIDEAAQAEEPQAVIAIGGILKKGGQLVLAGDPKQLGPVCNSLDAKKLGLGTSLLDRLKTLYEREENSSTLNYLFTKLLINYRNHPDILEIPNKLFYDGELKKEDNYLPTDEISQIVLEIDNKSKKKIKIKPSAIEFWGVNGVERREGQSPSFFNVKEITYVLKYVRKLIKKGVEQTDIGIIAPYIRQVQRIRNRLRYETFENVEVGTTEAFQGREKRIIIISTVRAQTSFLNYDRQYNLGFVVDSKRFNVAITRAQSKLIVIGNPQCLYTNENWTRFINKCKELGSYRGFNIQERTEDEQNRIRTRVQQVRFN